MSITRREMLVGSAAGLTTVALRRHVGAQEKSSLSINDRLRAIPIDLPSLDHRTEMLTEGASHALVAIPGIHWANDISLGGAMDVAICQEQIYAVLKKLIEGKHMDTIYAEGMPAEGEPPFDPQYCKNVSAEDRKFIGVPRIAEVGAVQILTEEKHVRCRGAEKTAAFHASGPAFFLPPGARRRELLNEARERALLEIIVQERQEIAWTVFGALHDWTNNVKEWNEAHPDATFSLVTLYTSFVTKFLERLAPNQRE